MKTKSWAALILTFSMLFSLLSPQAFAEETETVIFSGIDGTAGFSNESYDKLFDNDLYTKWCVSAPSPYVVVKASKKTVVTGYTFTTANDTDKFPYRNPRSWSLLGSNDYDETNHTGEWTELPNGGMDNDITMKAVKYTPYSFDFPNSTPYQYYKLMINEGWGDDIIQLSEIKFSYSDCEHVFEIPVNTPATCTEVGHYNTKCIKCSRTLDIIIPVLGHSFDEDNLSCLACDAKLCAKTGDMYYTDLQTAVDMASRGSTVALLDDTIITNTVKIEKDVVIELNGKTLTQEGSGSIFIIKNGKAFTLNDSSEYGQGTIQGGNAENGGGVHITNNSRFIMNGGNISYCTADNNGGGVAIEGSCGFEMNGGNISHCTAGNNGGGVYSNGNFTVSGAPQIYTNLKKSGDEYENSSNVYLNSSGKITIGEEGLNEIETAIGFIAPCISITMQNSENNIAESTADCSKYFISDDDGYITVYKNGAVKLAKACTVTFDYNIYDGGYNYVQPEKTVKGSAIPEPEELLAHKDGYRFLGWFKNGEIYDFGETVNEDFTLTAKWAKDGEAAIALYADRYIISGLSETEFPDVYLASYNEKGALIDQKRITATNGEMLIMKTGLETNGAEKIKAFIWNEKMLPVCGSAVKTLKQSR